MKTFGHRYWQDYPYRYASSGPDYHGQWSGELIFTEAKLSCDPSFWPDSLVRQWMKEAHIGQTLERDGGGFGKCEVFRRID